MQVERITLLAVACIGVVVSVASFFIDIAWVSAHGVSFLLAEVSAILGLVIVEFSRIRNGQAELIANSDKTVVLTTTELVYGAATRVLRESATDSVDRSIWMFSGTGGPNDRLIQNKRDGVQLDFDRDLSTALCRVGWSARIIYGIEDLDRLEWVYNYLKTLEKADDLEVRAFIRRDGSMLTPLIIGHNDVLVAVGDRRYFRRVKTCLHLQGQEANAFMRTYFDSLWQTPGLYTLRSPVGVVEETFDHLRLQLAHATAN